MSEQAQGQPAPENTAAPTEDAPQVSNQEQASSEPEVPKGYVSQDTVGKAAGKARDEGRKAAVNELLQSLGLESTEDLQSVVTERRQAQEAQATEAEKLQKNLEKAAKERDTTKAELDEAYSHIAQITQERALANAFIGAGVNPERMAAALRQADMDSLDVNDDGEVVNIEKVVEQVKGELPEIFQQPARSIGASSNPGTEQIANPGFDQMDDATFQEMRKRVLFGERIPT